MPLLNAILVLGVYGRKISTRSSLVTVIGGSDHGVVLQAHQVFVSHSVSAALDSPRKATPSMGGLLQFGSIY